MIKVKTNNSIILLDNILHGIPHNNLHSWCSDISETMLALPTQIHNMKLYQSLPTDGQVMVYAKYSGFYKELNHFPQFNIMVFSDNQLLLTFELIETLLPKTKIGLDITSREEFIRFKHYVANYGLSEYEHNSTSISIETVKQANWFDGAIAYLYHSHGNLKQLTRKIAIQEHIARQLKVHPCEIEVLGWQIARWRKEPASMYVVEVKEDNNGFKVSGP